MNLICRLVGHKFEEVWVYGIVPRIDDRFKEDKRLRKDGKISCVIIQECKRCGVRL